MARTPVSFGATDFYRSFRKKNPKTVLSQKVHATILACAGDVITEILLEEGEFKLFSRMGEFNIRTIKPKGTLRRMIDFHQTRVTGKSVYHFNDHSNGYLAKLVWDKRRCILADKFM